MQMADSLTPLIQTRVSYSCSEDEGEPDDIRKKLFLGSETPFVRRESLLSHLHSKQPVQVYLRIRPKSLLEIQNHETTCLFPKDDNVLLAIAPKNSRVFRNLGKSQNEQSRKFIFSHIYDSAIGQREIFDDAVIPVVRDFFDGQNCLMFCYGVTNSGKTYTITGTSGEPGVLPRTLDVIFNSIKGNHFESLYIKPKFHSEATYLNDIEQENELAIKETLLKTAEIILQSTHASQLISTTLPENTTFSDIDATCNTTSSDISKITIEAGSLGASMLEDLTVHEEQVLDVDTQCGNLLFSIWISFAEIYNEFIYDLLGNQPDHGKPRPSLKLSDDRYHNPYIKDLREIKINSTEEALQLLRVGLRHRHIAGTRLNYQSSRSHAIFTIKIVRVVKSTRRPRVARVNRISIVDLAGSERSKKTGATGDRCKEAGSINTSLHVLGRCIEGMRHNQKATKKSDEKIVPFRDSKLTKLLQPYFVGKGRGNREGRVVMVLNVSDIGSVFDETSHVLKFSALASKVIPTTHPSVQSLIPIPELSPMKPEPNDKVENEDTNNEQMNEIEEMRPVTVSRCANCKHLKEQLQYCIDKAKDEVAELKVKLWENEYKIRQQVSQEYNQQIVEIEEKMNREIEEQEATMEEELERRMYHYQKSTKKLYCRKRMRTCSENDDEEKDEQLREIESLQKMKRQLEINIQELTDELDMEKSKHASELRDVQSSYESKIVLMHEQHNASTVQVMDLKSTVLSLENEITKRKKAEDELQEKLIDMKSKLEAEVESLTKQEGDKHTQEIAMLKKEVLRLTSEFEESEKGRLDMKKGFDVLNEEKQREVSEFENLLECQASELTDVKKEIASLKDSLHLAEISLEEEKEKYRDIEKKNDEQMRLNQEEFEREMNEMEEKQKQFQKERKELKTREEECVKKQNELIEKETNFEREELLLQLVAYETKNKAVCIMCAETQTESGLVESVETQTKSGLVESVETQTDTDEIKKEKKEWKHWKEKCEEEKHLRSLADSEHEKKCSLLHDKLKEKDTEIKLVEKNLKEARRKLVSVETSLNDKLSKEKEISKRMEDVMKQNLALEDKMKKMEEENSSVEKSTSKKLVAMETLLTETQLKEMGNLRKIERMAKENTDLEKRMKNSEEETERTKQESLDKVVAMETLLSETQSKEKENLQEIERMMKENTDLEKRMKNSEEETERTKQESLDKVVAMETLLSETQSKEKENLQKIERMMKENTDLENRMKNSKEETECTKQESLDKVVAMETLLSETQSKEKENLQEIERMMKENTDLENRMKEENKRIEQESLKVVAMETTMEENEYKYKESLRRIECLENEKRDLEEKLRAHTTTIQTEKSNPSNTGSNVQHIYDVPPDTNEEPLYDSIHIDDKDIKNVRNDEILIDLTSSSSPMDDTRRLPLLERSSLLDDSFDDFEPPKRHVKYNPLKDARRKKPTKKKGAPKKATKKEVTDECLSTDGSTSGGRYMLRSRKKPVDTDTDNDENKPPTTPLLSRMFKNPRRPRGATTGKKFRKSQISGPIELENIQTPEMPLRSTGISLKLGHSVKPIRKTSQLI